MSKTDLLTCSLELYTSTEEFINYLDSLMTEAAKQSTAEHELFISQLKDLAVMSGADKAKTETIANKILDGCINAIADIAYSLYISGLEDGLRLTGKEIGAELIRQTVKRGKVRPPVLT